MVTTEDFPVHLKSPNIAGSVLTPHCQQPREVTLVCFCWLIKWTACILCEAINNMNLSGLLAQMELLALLISSIITYLTRGHNFLILLLSSVPIMLKRSFQNELLKHTPEPLFKKSVVPFTWIKTPILSASHPHPFLVRLLLCFILNRSS